MIFQQFPIDEVILADREPWADVLHMVDDSTTTQEVWIWSREPKIMSNRSYLPAEIFDCLDPAACVTSLSRPAMSDCTVAVYDRPDLPVLELRKACLRYGQQEAKK